MDISRSWKFYVGKFLAKKFACRLVISERGWKQVQKSRCWRLWCSKVHYEVGKLQLHKTFQPACKLINLEFKPNFECASDYWSIWICRLFDLANDRFWWVFVFSVLMETVWYNEKKSILRIFLVSTLFSAVQTVSSVNEIEKP